MWEIPLHACSNRLLRIAISSTLETVALALGAKKRSERFAKLAPCD
jgi:hypothetical protein